jgi:hypothetical protein
MNNSTRKCKKDYCDKVFIQKLQAFRDKLAKTLKIKSTKFTQKEKKDSVKKCFKAYCNPTCKGTIFQDGKEFPKNITLTSKKKKIRDLAITMLKGFRKQMFGKKNSVLKDGFYEKLNSKTVKQLKKKGALSGCTIAALK